MKSLLGCILEDKALIVSEVENLLNLPHQNAYQLSMPLLISAIVGEENLYQRACYQMEEALQEVSSTTTTFPLTYQAWLYGRLVMAADCMADFRKMPNYLRKLKLLINDKACNDDQYKAWALGYLANINEYEYFAHKEQLHKAAQELSRHYSQEKTPESLSDAMWAWIMLIQAAANAHDSNFYAEALKNMLKLAGNPSITQALEATLKRTPERNDYLAWGMGITALAALSMNDEETYHQLEEPLKKHMSHAQHAHAISEYLLALVTEHLIAMENLLPRLRK